MIRARETIVIIYNPFPLILKTRGWHARLVPVAATRNPVKRKLHGAVSAEMAIIAIFRKNF